MAWMEFLASSSPSWTSCLDKTYGNTFMRSPRKSMSKPCVSGFYMELDDDDYGDDEFDDTDTDDMPEDGQGAQRVNAESIDEITMIEGTSEKIGVPEQWDSLSVKCKILVPEQRKESCASASSAAEKLKRGKIRVIRNLMRHSLKVPSRGLLKPLLFKRKYQLPSV